MKKNPKKRVVHVPVSKSGSKGKKDDAPKKPGKPEEATGEQIEEPREEGLEDLKKKAKEYDELVDTLQRLKAEYVNYQKRIERERKEWRQSCVRELFGKVLPVLDNLERAIAAAKQFEDKSGRVSRSESGELLAGVEMISGELLKILSTEEIEPFESEGEKFDPRIHEAVMVEPTNEIEPDIVLTEIQRGYMIGDKVLRAAKVTVSQRPPGDSEPQE
jgi:molecular chaperone GrpE